MKTLFKNALILSMKDGEKPYKADLLVEGNKIAKIADGIRADGAEVIDASDTVLMPGFKNAHTHSAMTFSRSSSDNLPLSDWLTGCIFPMEDKLEEGDVYTLSKAAYLEYLTSGITACFDMYFFPPETARAAAEFGFKAHVLTMPADNDGVDGVAAKLKRVADVDKNLIISSVGVHAEYTTGEEQLLFVKELLHKFKSPFYTHSSETAGEVEGCKERHGGLTPTQYFEKLGLFDYGGVLYHNVHVNAEDIEIMKRRNITAVTCPGSNAKLASGVAPIAALLKNGVTVAIGTDGAGSNNCLDMFKEMHLLYSLAKLKEGDATALSAFEILKMATVNGALAMGFNDSLYIAEGQRADIILIDLLRPNMQPLNNVVSNIVYAGSKENVKLTMIDGRILYRDYKFYVGEDVKDVYQKVQSVTDRLNKDNKFKV